MADVAADAAKAMADAYKCEAFASHRAMAQSAKVDAVIICTPPADHVDICMDLLRKKVPVLCEKPLSTDAKSAQRLSSIRSSSRA